MENKDKIVIEVISRYQQRLFSLALYLLGGNQDKAYDICAESFAEALAASFSFREDDDFFATAAAFVAKKARKVKTIPNLEILDIVEAAPEEKSGLEVVARALHFLDFDEKAALLLREQCSCSYKDIAKIIGVSEKEARRCLNQARGRLRDKIKEIVNPG